MKWMKRKNVKCSGLFLWKNCNLNGRRSRGLTAARGMIQSTYILTIIFPIKTFQKQLKDFQMQNFKQDGKMRLPYPKFSLHGGQQLKLRHDLDGCPRGGTPDFKWQGWSNGGKNQNPKKSPGLHTNPKKSLDQNLTPQKSHAEFPKCAN